MATFEAKVCKLTIEEHPNADALELARIGGYVSAVKKGEFKTGDLGVYIPEAAIVPEWMLEKMGLTGRLAGKNKNRVKATRLRGIMSQGLVYPVEFRPNCVETNTGTERGKIKDIYCITREEGGAGYLVEEGDDVTELLGISKYIPKIPTSMSGEVFNAFGNTPKYDIENIKRYPDVIKCCEEVSLTEKIHGTWACFGYHPEYDFPLITSKGLSEKGLAFKYNSKNIRENLYVKVFESYTDKDQCDMIENFIYFAMNSDWDSWTEPFYLLGEIFGSNVQDLKYGDTPSNFRLFDVYVGQPGEGRYLDVDEVKGIAKSLNLEYVPELYRGPSSYEKLTEYTDGKETVSGKEVHMREGVVIRPLTERRDEELGRVILKSVSDIYLDRKNGTEYN